MSVLCLALCLFSILFTEINAQVCTRTLTTHTEKFVWSGDVIKNRTTAVSVHMVIKKCCPGYYTVDPQKEASSNNCLRICKMNCTTNTCNNNERCIYPDGFTKDQLAALCIPKPTPERISSDNETDSDNGTKPDDSDHKDGETNLFATFFFLSASVNVMLLLIIALILRKNIFSKCKTNRENRNTTDNVPEHRGAQYMDMRGAHADNLVDLHNTQAIPQNNGPKCDDAQYLAMDRHHQRSPIDPPQYECINESEEAPSYDYVQTPLPIHLRKAVQGVPRRG